MNELIETNKQRIDWIDALKFIGIFLIYFGHFGTAGGLWYPFVFTYHVPLFFVMSGFFALKIQKKSFFSFIKSKFNALIIPYVLFSIINIIIITINANGSPYDIINMFKQSTLGIRNHLFSGSLWFLPCLFVVSIMFEGLHRILKNKYLVLLISLLLYIVSEKLLPHRPIADPQWFFNIDSAIYYIIYYAIGAVVFPSLKKFKFHNIRLYAKAIIIGATILSVIHTVYVYYQKSSFLTKIFTVSGLNLFYPVISACIIIYLNILIAKILSNIDIIKLIGKNTLILCGNETIIKLIISNFFSMIGLEITFHTPLITFMYTLAVLIISCYTIIPFEKKCFPNILDNNRKL